MVARSRNVVSGMVTGSPPGRSTYKVPYDRVKAMVEIGVSTALLMLASPIILLCLLAVRLSSKGSPLYSQKRSGSCGRITTIDKIRTRLIRGFGGLQSGLRRNSFRSRHLAQGAGDAGFLPQLYVTP